MPDDPKSPQPAGSPKPVGNKPGRPPKATDAMVDLAERMLGVATKATIKAALMKQSGCCAKTCETIISRARARVAAQLGEPRDLLKAKYLAVYDSIAFDTTRETTPDGLPGRRKVSDRDRIHAASEACKLLGLPAQFAEPQDDVTQLLNKFVATHAPALPPGAVPSPPPPPQTPPTCNPSPAPSAGTPAPASSPAPTT